MNQLHCHTAFGSLLDSTVRPEELPKRAKELGMEAVAITEHGTLMSSVSFYKACKKEGIKPIIGCEFYLCDDMSVKDNDSKYEHLVVLAKNNVGYKNLLKLSSFGYLKGMYYKPRIDFKTLVEHKEGLIVLSACLGGSVPKLIQKGIDPTTLIKSYQREFGEDYYLEVQSADNDDQEKVNIELARLSKELDVELVATSDVHFLNKDDYDLHGVFIRINQDRDNEVYQDCWFKTEQEVFDVLNKHIGMDDTMKAISNTHVIADKCNVEIELGNSYLPNFPIPREFKSEEDYLKHLINKGFVARGINKKPNLQEYVNRAKMEYDVISKKGFAGYFLIVADMLEKCRQRGIYTGDGRGSVGGSIIAYLLGITNVDSVYFDLDFSRFLTMERVALCDVDSDLESARRQEVLDILRETYGSENVGQIMTLGTLQAKACLDSVGKVLGVPYKTISDIKKCLQDQQTIEDNLKSNSKLQKYHEEYRQLIDYCARLEGLPKSVGVHAAAIVVAPQGKHIYDYSPVLLSKEGTVITQLDMHDTEDVGLVKLDCLGLNTLDVINGALDLVYGGE